MTFQQIKVETTLIPHFYVILTAKFISDPPFFDLQSSLKTEGQFQGPKFNFKVK